MARLSVSPLRGLSRTHTRATTYPADSLTFDWVVVALAAWFTGGVFLDGWAHNHQPGLESFFTPWHAVLYSGYGAVAAVILGTALRNWMNGYALTRVLPRGYGLAPAGVGIFSLGAFGDMLWHTFFGIEVDVEALMSPTHLALGLGGILTLTGPVRAAFHRTSDRPRLRDILPALLALTFTLSVFAFFTQYAHPFGDTAAALSHRPAGGRGSIFLNQALGVMAILGQTALLMGFALFALRRWSLPLGSLALMFGLNTALVALMRDGAYTDDAIATGAWPMIGVAVAAGLVGDLLIKLWQPSPARPLAFHAVAFLIPAVLYAFYFAALQMWGGGLWWTIHMWMGSIFLAGIVGLLLSYAMLPPRSQEQ